MAKAERFSEVDNFAKRLVAEGHTDTVIIKEQQDILRFVSSGQWQMISSRKRAVLFLNQIINEFSQAYKRSWTFF